MHYMAKNTPNFKTIGINQELVLCNSFKNFTVDKGAPIRTQNYLNNPINPKDVQWGSGLALCRTVQFFQAKIE